MEAELQSALPYAEIETGDFGEIKVKVPADKYMEAAEKLYELGYIYCSDVTAADFLEEERLEAVARVYKMESKTAGVSLRADLPRNDAEIVSLTSVWPTAEWHEREAFDMYGIKYVGHPDLRPVLLPENWQGGHPLLKDFIDKRPPKPVLTKETYKEGV